MSVPRDLGGPAPLPFMGELMSCFRCGRQERSNPGIESSWYSFTMYDEGDRHAVRYYWCGKCKP